LGINSNLGFGKISRLNPKILGIGPYLNISGIRYLLAQNQTKETKYYPVYTRFKFYKDKVETYTVQNSNS